MAGKRPKAIDEDARIQIARDLPRHVEEYLKRGGKITKIPLGTTGYNPIKGKQHTVLEGSLDG